MLHFAAARRGSMLVVASAAPCMGFMIPGASVAGVGRGLHSGTHRPHTGMGPRMMAPRSPLHKDGARPLSGGPQQLGAMAAAVTAAITALPNTASAAAESVAGLAQASVASSASDQMMMEVGVFLAKTVISWGVPAAVIGFEFHSNMPNLVAAVSNQYVPEGGLASGAVADACSSARSTSALTT